MQPEFQGHVTLADEALNFDIRDLQIVQTESGPFLIAVNGVNGGLSVFDILDDRLTLQDSRLHTEATLLTGPVSTMGTDDARVMLGGTLGSDMQSYGISETGDLSAMSSQDLPGEGDEGLRASQYMSLGDGSAALYAVTASGTLAGWYFDASSGPPTAISFAELPELPTTTLLQSATLSGAQILLAADSASGGLTSYEIDPLTGALSIADQLGTAEGLAISAPTVLTSINSEGSHWVLLGSAGTDSLSLFELSEGGDLRFVDQVIDTSFSRFQGVSALETIDIEGSRFVVAAGQDDGFSIFRLLPEGRLIHLTSLEHEAGFGLENISALELVADGGHLHILAASQASGGITQFHVPLSDIGASLTAEGSSLTGSGAGDLLLGDMSATHISGGNGDDILVSQVAGDRLEGGAGQDIFVLHQIEGEVRILDFTIGEDLLDLSLISGLRNAGQLGFSSTATGAILTYQDMIIRLQNSDGGSLDLSDIFPQGISAIDRFELGDVSSDGVVYGSGAGDVLRGTSEADQIEGQSGDDSIEGMQGDDSLRGDDGVDTLTGGDGQDTLFGGLGNDQLTGGAGNDRIYGEQGDDRMFGEEGRDEIWGGDGDDFVKGGAGADEISGGTGHDQLRGSGDQDVLFGGAGSDLLKGNGGNDTLYGNDGADTLKGGRGDDRLEGGAWNDMLKGKLGNDTLLGGSGDDTLRGGAGNDMLYGGEGSDRLVGGSGDDSYWGDAGADIFAFRKEHGTDRIHDFTDGRDVIDLRFLGPGGAKQFRKLTITAEGDDVLIDTGRGQIWLSDMDIADIDGADFLF